MTFKQMVIYKCGRQKCGFHH